MSSLSLLCAKSFVGIGVETRWFKSSGSVAPKAYMKIEAAPDELACQPMHVVKAAMKDRVPKVQDRNGPESNRSAAWRLTEYCRKS